MKAIVTPVQKRPNRIRELRDERKLKLRHVAPKAGMSIAYLSQLELGKKPLDLSWMIKIAAELEVLPAELLPVEQGGLSADEADILLRYRRADATQRDKISRLIDVIVR